MIIGGCQIRRENGEKEKEKNNKKFKKKRYKNIWARESANNMEWTIFYIPRWSTTDDP